MAEEEGGEATVVFKGLSGLLVAVAQLSLI